MNGNLVLLGYMGSGKSTAGRSLASSLGVKFVDLDDYIEKKESKSISKIFNEQGAIRFRKLEKQSLQDVLSEYSNAIIAVGGGTPCYYENMQHINDLATSVYLQMSVKELAKRLWPEKQHRPLIAGITEYVDLQEFIGKHLFERNHFYQQAQHSILVDDLDQQEVVRQLSLLLA